MIVYHVFNARQFVSTHAPQRARQPNYKSLIRLRQYSQIRGQPEPTDGSAFLVQPEDTNVLRIKQIAKREPFGIFVLSGFAQVVSYGVVVVKHRHDHTDQYNADNHEL